MLLLIFLHVLDPSDAAAGTKAIKRSGGKIIFLTLPSLSFSQKTIWIWQSPPFASAKKASPVFIFTVYLLPFKLLHHLFFFFLLFNQKNTTRRKQPALITQHPSRNRQKINQYLEFRDHHCYLRWLSSSFNLITETFMRINIRFPVLCHMH